MCHVLRWGTDHNTLWHLRCAKSEWCAAPRTVRNYSCAAVPRGGVKSTFTNNDQSQINKTANNPPPKKQLKRQINSTQINVSITGENTFICWYFVFTELCKNQTKLKYNTEIRVHWHHTKSLIFWQKMIPLLSRLTEGTMCKRCKTLIKSAIRKRHHLLTDKGNIGN